MTVVKNEVQIRNGFTLVEMLVALGLMVFAISLFSSGLMSVINSAFFTQETLTRNDLTRIFKNAIVDRRSFQVTANATENQLIGAIITNDFSATGAMNTNQFYDMSIYDSTGLRLTGPRSNPVFYMVDGSICPPLVPYGAGQCVISATSSFMAQGQPKGSNLRRMSSVPVLPIAGYVSPSYPMGSPGARADFILVNFRIEFHPKPGLVDRKPASVSVFVNIEDLGF